MLSYESEALPTGNGPVCNGTGFMGVWFRALNCIIQGLFGLPGLGGVGYEIIKLTVDHIKELLPILWLFTVSCGQILALLMLVATCRRVEKMWVCCQGYADWYVVRGHPCGRITRWLHRWGACTNEMTVSLQPCSVLLVRYPLRMVWVGCWACSSIPPYQYL